MLASFITIAALCTVPQSTVVRESVNILEHHWYYDENGRLVFEQLIGWNEQNNVDFWRLIKTEGHKPAREPDCGYKTMFLDGDTMRAVYAPHARERWCQWDIELENREVYPKERRRELRGK